MRLNEIKTLKSVSRVTIDAGDTLGDLTFDVEYDYTPPYVDRHGSNSTFDERHDADYVIVSVKLAEKTDFYDDDGDKVVLTLPKGTDADQIPGWKKEFYDLILDELANSAK